MARSLDWIALQRASPLLAALPEPIRRFARLEEFPNSARLFSRGDRPKAMYFVVSGEVHLIRPSLTGGQLILQRAQRGFLAEASLDQPTYHCDAIVVRPAELLIISRKAFIDALSNEKFRSSWLQHLASELR